MKNPGRNKKDDLFCHRRGFCFDDEVAQVFDDMLPRSVPLYDEVHKIMEYLLRHHFPSGGLIYDLGTSTGTTLVRIHRELKSCGKEALLIGVDNSGSMIEKCREKLEREGVGGVELLEEDLDSFSPNPCHLVIINYTLQFLSPNKRLPLLQTIQRSLRPGGMLLLSEKIKSADSPINSILSDLHRDFKRENGYSDLEIARKREALENVLIPLTPEEQILMMKEASFSSCDLVLKKYNFACYLGIK